MKWREKYYKETKKKSFHIDLKKNSSALFNMESDTDYVEDFLVEESSERR